MKDKIQIPFFIKFGDRIHLEMLQKEGVVYMNTVNWFRTHENEEFRADKYDAYESVEQIKWLQIKELKTGKKFVFSAGAKENKLNSSQYWVSSEVIGLNLFCLYTVSSHFLKGKTQIDKKNKDMGNALLIITKPSIFLDKIDTAIKEKNLSFKRDVVEYIDINTYNGEIGYFKKSNKYSHQCEYRIVVESKKEEPLIIRIGNIESITKLYDIDMLEKIRFGYDNDK